MSKEHNEQVRTRFAPSPTGYMHIGNLRTALYAYLFAKSRGGNFVVRIEDTDQGRYLPGAIDVIYRTLADAGLDYDEGPDKGGDYGPYIQSERMSIYKKYADELIKAEGAYYCFCTKERLEQLRKEQQMAKLPTKYDGHCMHLSESEIQKKLASGQPWVIRQKIASEGNVAFNDEVFGLITVDNSTLDHNVLLKSDGMPTYNFANVIDDHLMDITHVIRGSEYLSSTPKYNLLYQTFGWQIPKYIHLPPVMRDAQNKLSKRQGDASYEDLIRQGYIKESIVNYIALLGWNPKSEREIFSLNELVNAFDIAGINRSPAIFDKNKLAWLSGEYIRKLPFEDLHARCLPYYKMAIKNPNINLKYITELLTPRLEKLEDILEQVDFIDELPVYNAEFYVNKKMKTDVENSAVVLKEILKVLDGVINWTKEDLHCKLIELVGKMNLKNGQVLWPLRTALSGKLFTPGGGIELACVLGKEETTKRIKHGLKLLENTQL